jgi:hypothetical protein
MAKVKTAKTDTSVETQAEYRQRVMNVVCEEIANSDLSLWDVCETIGDAPSARTISRWVAEDEELCQKYTRAKESQADFMAHQIRKIADECRHGEKREKKEIGRLCSCCNNPVKWQGQWRHDDKSVICEDAEAQPVYEEKISTGDMVERSRLQIDSRKWLAAKLAPKKYGDKLELAGDPDRPIIQRIERVVVKPT